jgi:hypothetical protein
MVYLQILEPLQQHFRLRTRIFVQTSKFVSFYIDNSTEKKRSWEANSYTANQDNRHILWNCTIGYHVHNRPSLFCIMNHDTQVHITTFHLSESNFNIILSSTIRSRKLSLSLRYGYLISTIRPNTCSSRVSLYVHPNDILWSVQIMKFLVWISIQHPVTSVRPYLHTYLRSGALLEKPPSVQPLKNLPAFYVTRRFITVFTRAFQWSLSWARSIHSL